MLYTDFLEMNNKKGIIMKKKILILIISVVLNACSFGNKDNINSSQAISNLKDTTEKKTLEVIDSIEGGEFLKLFYGKFYSNDENYTQHDMSQYVSDLILEKIDSLSSDGENLVLDYNPFIQGQDFSGKSITKTLKIKPLGETNQFLVKFNLFDDDNHETTIKYQLAKEKGGRIKIVNILSDSILIVR